MITTFAAAASIAVVAVLLVLLITDSVRPVIAFLGAAGALLLLQILTPAQALQGFSSPVIATLALLFIINKAVEKTGLLNDAIRFIRSDKDFRFESVLVFVLMLPVALLSSILNNTPIVLLLVPVVKRWGKKHGVASSKLLIPLSYAAIFGGMWTIIGTSTNLLINNLYSEYSGQSMLFFEPAAVGIPLTILGIAYMSLIGHRFLPSKPDSADRFQQHSEQYLIELMVPPASRLNGMTVEDAGFRELEGVYLVQLFRGNEDIGVPSPGEILHEGDSLIFAGNVESARDLAEEKHLVPGGANYFRREGRETTLLEGVVRYDSALAGKSVKELSFRSRFNSAVVAVHRRGQKLSGRIGDVRLRAGDNLLLITDPQGMSGLEQSRDFYILDRVKQVDMLTRPQRWLVYFGTLLTIALSALSTMGIVVGIGGKPMGLFHFAAIFVAILFISGTVTTSDIKSAIRFDVLLIIASAMGIAAALETTGISALLGQWLSGFSDGLDSLALLAIVYVITNLVTEAVTNNAAAVLMFPIAMAASRSSAIDPRAMVLVILVAAGASFSTPMGYQTNLIVQSAAQYRFIDFIRAGLPMNLLAFVICMVTVNYLYL